MKNPNNIKKILLVIVLIVIILLLIIAGINLSKKGYEATTTLLADINNDGQKDVVTVVSATSGGSGYFYYLTVFINDQGSLKYQTSVLLGDRIEVKKLSYAGGIFTVDIITQGPNEPMCCGTTPAELKFRIEKGELVKI